MMKWTETLNAGREIDACLGNRAIRCGRTRQRPFHDGRLTMGGWQRILGPAPLRLLAILLIGLVVGHSTADADDPDPIPVCALYTAGHQPGHSSQLLALDLRNKRSYPLGDLLDKEVRGMAVHPLTSVLYAVTDRVDGQPGLLYRVDRATGAMSPVGPHGFNSISALAFRWTDATLWGWAKGVGLVQIDTDTGAGEVRYASDEMFSGIAWDNDGSRIFLCRNKTLWSYSVGGAELERVANNLPRGTVAIEIRTDGLLVGIGVQTQAGDDGGVSFLLEQAWVFIYDPQSRELISQNPIPVPKVYASFSGFAWSRACGNPSPGGPADMIDSIVFNPAAQVCPGQDLLVTVEATHPETDQGQVDIAINGDLGSPQLLHFEGVPGERLITITASTPEHFFDSEQATIEVVDCGPDYEFLDVAVRANPFHEHTIDFVVENDESFGGQDPTYLWEFGDGQPVLDTGEIPYASHSYATLIRGESRDDPYKNVEVTITLRRSGHADLTARRAVTLWNLYATNKQRGIIHLPVDSDGLLRPSGAAWTGAFTVSNLEDFPIQLDWRQTTLHPCDPDADPLILPAEVVALDVPARGAANRQLSVSAASMTGMCGVDVSLRGDVGPRQRAYASAYFDADRRNPVMTRVQDDPALRHLLNQVSDGGLVVDPLHVTEEELYRLARQGKIEFPPPPIMVPSIASPQATAAGSQDLCDLTQCDPRDDPGHCLGQPCVPGDPTRPGVSCQATDDWCTAPAHVANALKGDVLLSVECEMIGKMMRKLSPAQVYSHSGIMTRNKYEVTHSTSVADRYKEEDYSGSDGFLEGVLRYGWPGVITQTVGMAFNGEEMHDNLGNPYLVFGFSADPHLCEGDSEPVYPRVIKPPPGSDREIREKLQDAADVALSTDGHYRFFAYTDADIVLSHAAPSSFPDPPPSYPLLPDPWLTARGWAEDTPATVCSQFIWHALKEVGVTLEGTLEEADAARTGQADGDTIDGLYLYTEDERFDAAEWTFNQVHNEVYDYAGWLGDAITDAADNVANQFVNCFVFDACEINTDESEEWRDPGE
ncbi:MAG: PKD domain-containing protein, partial [Nitrospirota bacterium]